MRNRYRFHSALAVLIAVCWPAVGLAQIAATGPTGSIAGTIADDHGSVIAGATVTVAPAAAPMPAPSSASPDKDQTQVTNSDKQGTYALALQPGSYVIRISANGFKTAVVENVVVHAGEALKINPNLAPNLVPNLVRGPESDVIAAAQPGDSSSTPAPIPQGPPSDSSVKNIPLATRNYTQATGMAPGASSPVSNATNIGMNSQGVQVGSGSTNNYVMDGASVAAATGGVDSPGAPNPDAIQASDVQSWSYSPGPERYAGANISVVTRSGGDAFHGTLFESVRNDIFNANDYFLKRAVFPNPVLKQNQFGVTLGGPILRNRVFFFGSYQGTRQRNGMAGPGFSPAITLAPLPSTRTAGTLGEAFCPANHPGDSRYNTVFGGVQVACDGSNINPVAVNLLNLNLANGGYLIPGSSNGTFRQTPFSIPAKFQEDQFLVNTDYVFSTKEKLEERFFYAHDPQTSNFVLGPQSLPGSPSTELAQDVYGVLKLNSSLTPTLLNEVRVSGQRDQLIDTPDVPFTNDEIGIDSVVSQINHIDIISVAGLFNLGGDGIWDSNNVNQYQAADHISWTVGKHALRAGVEVDRRQWNTNVRGDAIGSLTFQSIADLLLGLPGCPPNAADCSALNPIANGVATNGTPFSNVFASGGPGGPASDVTAPDGINHAYRFKDASAYLADDVKLSSRLTVTVGLRWDYFGLPADSTGNNTSFRPSLAQAGIAPPPGGSYLGFVVPSNFKGTLAPGVFRNSRTTALPHGSSFTSFAPRFGFSWQPLTRNTLAIRGGYGIFYDRPDAQTMEFATNTSVPYAVPVGGSGPANYQATFAQPFPKASLGWGPPRTADLTAGTSSNLSLNMLDEGFSTPLTQKWNLEVQEQLPHGLTALLGYAGAHSVRLLNSERQINEPQLASASHPVNGFTASTVSNASLRVPFLGVAPNGLNDIQTQASAKYNALEATLMERTSIGLHVQAAFQFSKTLSNEGIGMGLPRALGSVAMYSDDPLNARQQYGPSNSSVPIRLTVNYGWDLPWKSTHFARVLGGWGISGVTIIQSGMPMTIIDNRGGSIYGNAGLSRGQFCDGMDAHDVATHGNVKQRLNGYFNRAAFCKPPAIGDGTGYGNSSVGLILGPGQANTNLSVSKMISIRDSKLEFRAEMFNAFNHPQFGGPDNSVTDPTFGVINSTSVNPRLIQFGLKYSF